MQVFQKVIAVQEEALPGKNFRHLLRNPEPAPGHDRGRAISHAVHPSVLSIAGQQHQDQHLLSHPFRRTQRRRVASLPIPGLLHHAEPHFPPLGTPPPPGAAPPRSHSTLQGWPQLPSAYHAAVALHDQPRLPRPGIPPSLVAGQRLPAFPVHKSGGSSRLLLHYFSYAAAVQVNSVVFLELLTGPLERLLRPKVGQGPLQD